MPTTKAKSAKPASNSEHLRALYRPGVLEKGLKIIAKEQDEAAAKKDTSTPAATPPDEYISALAAKCVADARYEVAAEKRKAEADAKAEEPQLKASEAFVKAHFDWLRAVASIKDPEASDEEMEERFAAETAAERRFFITAAAYPEQVWQKLEAFEDVLHDELVSGQRNNGVLLLALGSIKQDMLNLELLEAIR